MKNSALFNLKGNLSLLLSAYVLCVDISLINLFYFSMVKACPSLKEKTPQHLFHKTNESCFEFSVGRVLLPSAGPHLNATQLFNLFSVLESDFNAAWKINVSKFHNYDKLLNEFPSVDRLGSITGPVSRSCIPAQTTHNGRPAGTTISTRPDL